MGDWGYARVAGVLRKMNWDDVLDDQFDLSGDAVGWGLNLSTNLKPGKNDVIRASVLVRRRRPELHERLAGGRRHREPVQQPGLADPRDTIPISPR